MFNCVRQDACSFNSPYDDGIDDNENRGDDDGDDDDDADANDDGLKWSRNNFERE